MDIELKEVAFEYNHKKKNEINEAAIIDINLSIDSKNEFIAVLGHTGSGKSTLMQHFNGLLLPTSGAVKIFDQIITGNKKKNPKLKPIRKRVGYVFQFPEYQLFDETVLKDIMFGPLNFGFTEEEAKENAIKYAKLLKIESILDKSPFNLSGGQMRKVAIAGILAYEPDVILLDEPTRGLDPLGALEIMDFFTKIHKEFNKTIIMVTHDMDLAYKHVNRAVVLCDGKIVFDDKKENLFLNNKYLDFHLQKPLILQTIDDLNSNLGYSLNYDISNMEDLILGLKGEAHG